MLIAGRKKIASTKGCAITPRCGVSDAKRERENLLVLIGRAITKTKMREKREKKEGKNKLQGNKRGGTNVRKGGERAASSRGFRTK